MKRKLWFRKLLFIVLLATVLIIPVVHASVTIKEDIVFRTSSNNTNFVMDVDFDFYQVEVNSTHLWMDKSYSSKNYTRYCIWVDATVETDQQQTTGSNTFNIYGNEWWAQSYTPTVDLQTKVGLYAKKTGSPADNFYVEIRKDDSGEPDMATGGLVASKSLSSGSFSTSYSWIDFDHPDFEVAESIYWVLMKSPNSVSAANGYQTAYSTSNPYGGGKMSYSNNGGSSWNPQSANDCRFKTYGLDDTQFTINSWFAAKDSSATLTIDAPLVANINVGLYSPNLLTASGRGVVSQTWYSGNTTLLMVVNSGTSSTFTITVTVTETQETNIAPENVEVTITDMEGGGNWVFSETEYYTFQAKYWDGNGYDDLDTMKIGFSDGNTWVSAVYDQTANTWGLESGSDVARIAAGTLTILDSNLLQVTFPIYFQNTILDALDVDIYMYCKNDPGAEDGWDLMQEDYFNIYNLGGHSTLETLGNAGRIPGGDVFDLFVNDTSTTGEPLVTTSSVEATMIFRNLQHIKMLPTYTVLVGGYGDYGNGFVQLDYFIDYGTEEDEWITGWGIGIGLSVVAQTADEHYIKFKIRSFNRGQLIKTENISMYHSETDYYENTTTRFWIDLWFNKINASSTIGVRINAYNYPMKNSANYWLRWLANNWGPDEDRLKQSMMFEDLLDSNNQRISASQIKMVRVRCKLYCGYNNYVCLHDYDVFDLTFAGDPMEGIQTPAFDETRVPVMPQGGFLGIVVAALHRIAARLADATGPILLSFFNVFVGFMDTIFSWTGNPTAFSDFLTMLGSFWGWMTTSFGYVVSFLGSIFTFLATIMTKFLNTVSTIITNWVSLIQGVFNALGGSLTAGINIWNDLGLSWWVIIIAIFYPIYLLGLWEKKGIDAVINQLRFLMDVAAFLIRLFITMIQTALNIIGRIIESIPIIE